MKIIDEKGKLFGKINLIDLLVILVIVAVAAVLLLKGGRKVGEATGLVEDKTITVEYQVYVNAQNKTTCDSVSAMDFSNRETAHMTNDGKMINAYVLRCERRPYLLTNVTDDGEIRYAEDVERGSLLFTVQAQVRYEDCAYKVGSQEIRVGKNHIVKTPDFELSGTIVSMEVIDG